jgi:uncharacterized protein (TIGR03435 family)
VIRRAIAAIAVLCCPAVSAQPAKERPSFEVASVKAMLVDDPKTDYVPHRSGDRITMHNAALARIIAWAYGVTDIEYGLVAAPTEKHLWDDYDIQALAPGSPSDDELRIMFQTLLEDRFQLKVHRENRELAAYDLVVAKGGPKLVAAPPRSVKPSMGFGGSSSWGEFRRDGKHLVGMSATVEEMAGVLTTQMRAPVRDRTGLAGTYDYDVAFSTGVDGSDKPVLATAIHQLGLNLAKSRGTFEVLVIDRLQLPSAN